MFRLLGVGLEAEGRAIFLLHLLRAPGIWLVHCGSLLLSLKVHKFLGRQKKGSFSWSLLALHSCFSRTDSGWGSYCYLSGVIFALCYDNPDTELSSFFWVAHMYIHTHMCTHTDKYSQKSLEGGMWVGCRVNVFEKQSGDRLHNSTNFTFNITHLVVLVRVLPRNKTSGIYLSIYQDKFIWRNWPIFAVQIWRPLDWRFRKELMLQFKFKGHLLAGFSLAEEGEGWSVFCSFQILTDKESYPHNGGQCTLLQAHWF